MPIKTEKNCNKCSKGYIPSCKSQKFCSRRCAMLTRGLQKTKKGTFLAACGWCNKSFTKRLSQQGKTGDFCCVKCGEAFKRGRSDKYISKPCPMCKKSFTRLYRNQTKFCSVSCSKSGKYHPLYGKKFKWASGKKAWTNGLFAKTDQRVANLGKTK